MLFGNFYPAVAGFAGREGASGTKGGGGDYQRLAKTMTATVMVTISRNTLALSHTHTPRRAGKCAVENKWVH